MEEREVMRLISQYLQEHGFTMALEALEKERYYSGREFKPDVMVQKTGELQAILDDHMSREKQKLEVASSVDHLFEAGEDQYANQLWCSFNDLTGGVNVLVVKLIETGVLAFGASKALVGSAELSLPLPSDTPPISPIPTLHKLSKGAVLALDFHPHKRNLVLCGSMDHLSLILDLDKPNSPLVQKFEDHTKYVVRTLWAPSGKYFITGSYDKSICVYRERDDDAGLYERAQKLDLKGAVEGLDFARGEDVFVVGVRNDYLLHCYDLSSGTAVKTREINVNAFGDDYVSFVPMHLSFSPNGRFILVSTDRDRLIMYSWDTGKQIANFYGATNDEYSQPRHCWDPSGKYIYGTSQDHSIVVWEIKTQAVVKRLHGHEGTVRDLHYCNELGLLVSCGFDGSVKIWRNAT